MSSTTLRRIAISVILIATTFGLNGKASGPAPPQAQEQPGQPITLEVDAHSSLFVDPLWSSGSQGTCRYLTNPSSSEWFVPIGSQAEWQSMETSSDNQYSQNYATQQVCCRPSTGTQNATLCASSAGGPRSAQIVGSDPTGYGVLGSTGYASATCSDPPYGSYAETQTFTCGLDPTKPSTGVGADGAWSAETGDTRTCQPNAYTTYGGCSATCGGGNLYETVYNSCGQITSQGYFGPSCNTQSCCTTDYEKTGCSGSTAIEQDFGTCNGPQRSIPGGCSFVDEVVGGASCTYSVPNYSPGGYGGPTSTSYYEFYDCGGGAASTWVNWGTTSGAGVSCQTSDGEEPYDVYVNGVYMRSGQAPSPDSKTCTYQGWQ